MLRLNFWLQEYKMSKKKFVSLNKIIGLIVMEMKTKIQNEAQG